MKRTNAFMELSRRAESFEFMDIALLIVWYIYLLIIFNGAHWEIFLSLPVFFLQLLNRDYRKDRKSFAYSLSISIKQSTYSNLFYSLFYWIFTFIIVTIMALLQYFVYKMEGSEMGVNYFQYWKGTLFFVVLSLVIMGLNHPLMYIKSKRIWFLWETGVLAIVIIIKQFFYWIIPDKYQMKTGGELLINVGISNSPQWWIYLLIIGGIAVVSILFAYVVVNLLQKNSRNFN